MHKIALTPRALRELEAITTIRDRRRIVARIDTLATNPRPRGVCKLTGSENSYRLRVGLYRVMYEIEDEILTVTVVRVRHGGDVYRGRR